MTEYSPLYKTWMLSLLVAVYACGFIDRHSGEVDGWGRIHRHHKGFDIEVGFDQRLDRQDADGQGH